MFRLLKAHYHKPFSFSPFWPSGSSGSCSSRLKNNHPFASFRPGRIFVPELAAKYNWLKHIYTTFVEIFFGFAITAFLGVFLAVLISWSRFSGGLSPRCSLFLTPSQDRHGSLFILWFATGLSPISSSPF